MVFLLWLFGVTITGKEAIFTEKGMCDLKSQKNGLVRRLTLAINIVTGMEKY